MAQHFCRWHVWHGTWSMLKGLQAMSHGTWHFLLFLNHRGVWTICQT